jgi:phosphoesterase RecJ-like protein
VTVEDLLGEAAEVVAGADRLAMACHVGPDGDALGSMLALALACRNHGKEVLASFGNPFTLGDTFRFLPTGMLVPPAAVPDAPEVMVSFDAGSADRLGDLAANAAAAGKLIVIDHHVTNRGFGHLDLIDPEAAATAEIVYRLIRAIGWPIDADIATCLHTGIVTDTGRFQYANTTPGTLEVAARLVEAGARPEVIGRHVYEETPFGYLAVAGAVLGRAKLDAERRLVWSVLHRSDLESAGIGPDDVDSLIDLVRVARESDVAMLVKELSERRVKVSLRSRGRVDVGAIAAALGGGGHHNAAGFTFAGSPEEATAAVVGRLDPVEP